MKWLTTNTHTPSIKVDLLLFQFNFRNVESRMSESVACQEAGNEKCGKIDS